MPYRHEYQAVVKPDDEHRLSDNGSPKAKLTMKTRLHKLEITPSYAFITCKLSAAHVNTLISRLTPRGHESIYFGESSPEGRDTLEARMRTRNAWSQNLANLKVQRGVEDEPVNESTTKPKQNSTLAAATPNRKSILKQTQGSPNVTTPNATAARRQPNRMRQVAKRVSLNPNSPTVYRYVPPLDAIDSESDTTGACAERSGLKEGEEADAEHTGRKNNMSQLGHRPSLKLKLSTTNFNVQPPSNQPVQTPNPQSAVRTPSIKLNFGKKPSISAASKPVITLEAKENGTPSSGKKRKRTKADEGSEDELAKPPPQRRLTLKTSGAPAKTPVTPGPVFRLKTKGKVPKRPLGVGYDSELEEREVDPVILEGFILRMPPGPDCDYVQVAIRDGTVGMHRAQGGPDIRMRSLDTNGRRGTLIVNGHQYATAVVDLPCIVEGMKSWDKKGWIKSIDICQMMLVLGICHSDEEAKNYPLPSDVDPKTHAYAHGLTAPMKWVRKRRFARTRRARVDDIESIERKVNALLEADAKALSSSFQIFDHDPRVEQDQYSEVEDEYEDDDAEGELEDGYFPRQAGLMVETPGGMQVDAHVDQDQIDDIEAMFNEDEEDATAPTANGHAAPTVAVGLTVHHQHQHQHHLDNHDSSVAVTSASASPSVSAAVTAAPTPAEMPHASSDDDEDDDDEDASDRSDSEKDADDNLQQVKDRIADMESKIREQTELLRKTPNAILKKKLARKIGELRDDVRMMKVQNGLAAEGDEDDGDE